MKNSVLFLLICFVLFSCSKDEAPPTVNSGGNGNGNGNAIPAEFAAWAGIFNGNGVGAAVNVTEDLVLLFNQDGDTYAWFEDNEIKATGSVTSSTGIFSGYQLGDVGAAVLYNNSTLYFFGKDGDEYQTAPIDVNDFEGRWNDVGLVAMSNNVNQLWEWGIDYTCPFSRIGAMWNMSDPGTGCFDQMEDHDHTWMVNDLGDEVVKYYAGSGGVFDTEEELENWLAENNCGGADGLIPFTSISAACRYMLPNKIIDIFFSADGKQFSYYNVSEGIFTPIYDLY